MAIIASKSSVLSKILAENMSAQLQQTGSSLNPGREHKQVVIDFKGQVHYQSFVKILDYCYLGDMNIFGQISDSNEMIEIIKLANRYNLSGMIRHIESVF